MKTIQKSFFTYCLALITLVADCFGPGSAYAQTITIPNSPPTVTSADFSALLRNDYSLHIQDVYSSTFFSNGPVSISEIRFLRRVGTAPFSNATMFIKISMSTTPRSPDTLSSTFSSNVGVDEAVVFNGNVTLSSQAPQNFDPLNTPYDIAIPLTTPFIYDPSKGHLLLDFREYSGGIPSGVVAFNVSTDKASRVVGYSSDAVSGTPDTGTEPVTLVVTPTGTSADISFFPSGGSFTNTLQVTIQSRLSNGQIRYTVNGIDPTANSPSYSNSFQITDTTTVKARYFVNGFPSSAVFSASFTKADPILFSPAGGLFTNSVQIVLANTLGTGTIRYTLDGTAPTNGSSLYTGPFAITEARTVSARLFLNSFPISDIYASNYARVYAVSNDGIPNSWRQQYFGAGYATDPRVSADADPDNDGSTNIQEYIAGTNPVDPNSGFRITFRAIPLLNWKSLINSNYNVLRRPSLSSGSFTTIATIKATNSTTSFIDIEAGAASSQYYYTIQLAP